MSIWNELGISPTKNVREIKKAYAAKSKLVHPEEHPEEFQKLHDAYRAALDIANSDISFAPPALKAEQIEQKMPESVCAPIKEEDNSLDFGKISKENKTDEETKQSFDFEKAVNANKHHADMKKEPEESFDFGDAIHRNSLRHDNAVMEKTEIVIKNANALYHHKLNDKEQDWLKVFDKNELEEIKFEPIFMEELYKFLNSHKIMSIGLFNAIYQLYDIGNAQIDYHDMGKFEDIYQWIIKDKLRIQDVLFNSIKLCSALISIVALVVVVLWSQGSWLISIPVMLPIFFLIIKIEKLKKRKKNFHERYF